MAEDSAEQQMMAPPPAPPADDPPEGAPDWIVTFADLATLLLCFFVLLLSFSRMDDAQFKEVAGSLKEAFGVQRVVPVWDLPRGIDMISRDFNTTFTTDLAEKIRTAVKQAGGKEEGTSVEENARGLLINLPGSVLFGPASAGITEEGKTLLAAISPILREVGGELHIEGHTDATPFGAGVGAGAGALDGNWRLSFDRALSVLGFFASEGFAPGTLVPIGRGSSVPVASNATPEGQQANRRVEILLLKGFSQTDEQDMEIAARARASADASAASAAAGTGDAASEGLEADLHIPEANFSPTEQLSDGPSGPVSLFPE